MNSIKKIKKATEKKLLAKREYILYFLLQANVTPDNNGSERAIRNIKVKQKYQANSKHWKVQIYLPSLDLLLIPLSKMVTAC